MVIETRIARRYWVRKALLAFMFFAFGCLALYDGFVKYPKEVVLYNENLEYEQLKQQRASSSLTQAEATRFAELDTKFSDPTMGKIPKRSQKDIVLQHGLAVLCFPAALALVITWLISARRKFIIQEDGTLIAPEGTFPPSAMTDIDMTRWMDKSIARLEINGGPDKGGAAVKLDAWIYDGMDETIENLARRFHPEQYADKPPVAAAAASNDEPRLAGQTSRGG